MRTGPSQPSARAMRSRLVTIARCMIRLRHQDAADSDLFHGAKSSNMVFPFRFC